MDEIYETRNRIWMIVMVSCSVALVVFFIYKKCDVYECLNNCLSGSSCMASREETFSDVDSEATTVVV